VLKPCDENLATQIEEGYIKLKPFRIQTTSIKPPSSEPSSKEEKEKEISKSAERSPQIKPQDTDKLPTRTASPFRFPLPLSKTPTISPNPSSVVETPKKDLVWKLLGEQHMGKYVVYTNATTAWLLSDDLYGKLTASVYQTLSAGVHLGGAKLVRGYVELSKKKEKEDKEVSELKPGSLLAKTTGDAKVMDDVADKAEEKEMEQDYDDSEKEDPTRYHCLESEFTDHRQIDHLILCVHGIGQKLGERMEGVNFVHGILSSSNWLD
jgi:hypothetical protein